jgi:hypothetical protein
VRKLLIAAALATITASPALADTPTVRCDDAMEAEEG